MSREATGIVRKVDALGRIVLPAEIRKELDVHENDSVEIFRKDGFLAFKKHEPSCVFCGGTDDMASFAGKNICAVCREKIAKLQ